MNKAVKTFYKNTTWMFETKNASTLALVSRLMFMTTLNSPEIVFGRETRTRMCEELGYSRVTMSRSMTELQERNVLAKMVDKNGNEVRDHYILNPRMYWYGDLETRDKAIKKYGKYFL